MQPSVDPSRLLTVILEVPTTSPVTYRGARRRAYRELPFEVETFYSGASATFSPFKDSGPFHNFAFFTEPSASFWNSMRKGASVVKKRVSDSGWSSIGSSPKTGYCTYNLPDFSVTLNLNSPLKMYSPVNVRSAAGLRFITTWSCRRPSGQTYSCATARSSSRLRPRPPCPFV